MEKFIIFAESEDVSVCYPVRSLVSMNGASSREIDMTFKGAAGGGIGAVDEIKIINGGSGYTSAPTITLDSPLNGDDSAATATVVGGIITGVTLSRNGNGYSKAPGVTVTGGGGSGADLSSVVKAPAIKGASDAEYNSRVRLTVKTDSVIKVMEVISKSIVANPVVTIFDGTELHDSISDDIIAVEIFVDTHSSIGERGLA